MRVRERQLSDLRFFWGRISWRRDFGGWSFFQCCWQMRNRIFVQEMSIHTILQRENIDWVAWGTIGAKMRSWIVRLPRKQECIQGMMQLLPFAFWSWGWFGRIFWYHWKRWTVWIWRWWRRGILRSGSKCDRVQLGQFNFGIHPLKHVSTLVQPAT